MKVKDEQDKNNRRYNHLCGEGEIQELEYFIYACWIYVKWHQRDDRYRYI